MILSSTKHIFAKNDFFIIIHKITKRQSNDKHKFDRRPPESAKVPKNQLLPNSIVLHREPKDKPIRKVKTGVELMKKNCQRIIESSKKKEKEHIEISCNDAAKMVSEFEN